jgi:hypothetical protein
MSLREGVLCPTACPERSEGKQSPQYDFPWLWEIASQKLLLRNSPFHVTASDLCETVFPSPGDCFARTERSLAMTVSS